MKELSGIVIAAADPLVTGLLRRTLSAMGGSNVECYEGWQEASARLAVQGADLMVVGPGCVEREAIVSGFSGGLYNGAASVLLISDEGDWPEGVSVLPTGHTPGQLEQALERILEERRRLGEKAYIEKMSQYVVPVESLSEADMKDDGSWSRRVAGGLVEVGVDVRRWFGEGKLLCVEHMDVSVLESGRPYARLLVGDGSAHTLLAPVSGRVREKNSGSDNAVCVLASKCASEGWSLWLLRVEPS